MAENPFSLAGKAALVTGAEYTVDGGTTAK
jgi:hypothetical protein